ncbi:MAG: hypothetical protein JWN76_2025 [Chitinophagaceae bacterium]|nr:hypothetical protein [Chitinophagaceae bacterium]
MNGNKIELTENNLRYITLASPLNSEATWKGNSYIDSKSVGSAFKYLDDWIYQYQHINEAFTVINRYVDSTVTVFHHDEIIGNRGLLHPMHTSKK